MKKTILIVLIISSFLGILFWKFGGIFLEQIKEKDKIIEINFWGLEEEMIYRPLIEKYQLANPKIKINYQKQSLLNYRPRVQTQVRAGQGPDIFIIQNSWLPMILDDLSVNPAQSAKEFAKIYYPLISDNLTYQGKIYAVPREIDGLALYYNEDILKAAGIAAPKNWQEFVESAKKVTVRNQSGQIQTAGAAMGSTNNVDYWSEIIGLLFLQQPEGKLDDPASRDGAEVLQFFTNFIMDPKNKTWDVNLPTSGEMFKSGRLAFYFAFSSKAAEIVAFNPELNFKVTTVPQLPGRNLSWGSFWAFAVSGKSEYKEQSWEFLNYLEKPENLVLLNQKRSEQGILDHPYPRMDLSEQQSKDSVLGPFITQAPYLKSWYLNSEGADGGINDEMISLYKEALGNVSGGGDSLNALRSISPRIKETLQKYIPAEK